MPTRALAKYQPRARSLDPVGGLGAWSGYTIGASAPSLGPTVSTQLSIQDVLGSPTRRTTPTIDRAYSPGATQQTHTDYLLGGQGPLGGGPPGGFQQQPGTGTGTGFPTGGSGFGFHMPQPQALEYPGFEWPTINLPGVPSYDPAEEARRLAEQQRQERIDAVNRMIDQKISELEREEGRVPGFYQDLREQLALSREGALEGSQGVLQSIERTFGSTAHQLHDIRDQWKNEAISTLMARGTLTSGQADRALREIDNIVAKNVTNVMRDKDIKITDVMEGKRNVQEAFTTAIGQAEREKQNYLKELSTLKREAEELRGAETANIEQMIATQTPILERELAQNLWAKEMQHAAAQHGMGMDIAQHQLAQQSFAHQQSMDQQRLAMQLAGMQAAGAPTQATMTPYQQASLGMRATDQWMRDRAWQEDQQWRMMQQTQADTSNLYNMFAPAMQDPMGVGIPMYGMAQTGMFGGMFPTLGEEALTGALGPMIAGQLQQEYQQYAQPPGGFSMWPWRQPHPMETWTAQQYGPGIYDQFSQYMGLTGQR